MVFHPGYIKKNITTEPPSKKIFINIEMIEGAFEVSLLQSVAHFMKIMIFIYPNRIERKIICGINSKNKSIGNLKYIAFKPFKTIPKSM
jgi:hypothetical protein